MIVFFFKQKTAYEMRISDWSSDVCSSDLLMVEITQRRSWRQFLTADLAVEFGYTKASRGRPAKVPPPLSTDRDLAEVFDRFDQELADIDALLARKIGRASCRARVCQCV